MPEKKLRVLVVDDSAVFRQIISDIVNSAPDMETAATASDGLKALEILDRANPDVISLDVQMPNMDGLATLDAILSRRAIPVVMVSSLTKLGANITLDALDRGAFDYISKPDYGVDTKSSIGEKLIAKLRTAAGADIRRIIEIREQRKKRQATKPKVAEAAPRPLTPSDDSAAAELANKCVALGISTGGPPALTELFETLAPPMPPMVIVQHMPPNFTKPLAWRLDAMAKLKVKEAETGDILKPNCVYIAPGGYHVQLKRSGVSAMIHLDSGPPVSSHKPSVDVMMKGASEIFGSRCLGVIMTGMGRDGADGCKFIRQAGGYVLGQDDETSDVYGMNKVAFVEGNVDKQFPLEKGASLIMAHVRKWLRQPAAV